MEQLFAADLRDSLSTNEVQIAGFLEGFERPDSREFAIWKDRIHARLLPKLTNVFILMVDCYRRHGDIRQIEHIANRMLLLDELCEDAVRAKMEVLALTGDRLAALRLYEEWRQKVDEELSARPSGAVDKIERNCASGGGKEPRLATFLDPRHRPQIVARHFCGTINSIQGHLRRLGARSNSPTRPRNGPW